MKIAITGGAGFIGTHLTKAYLDAGHDVLVVDTLKYGSLEAVDPRARFYHMDIRDGALQSLFQRERPDIVSHHAASRVEMGQPLEEKALLDADVHVRGLLNVLEGCVTASVSKFIFASGGNGLYGCPETMESLGEMTCAVDEDTPLCPLKPSDITKVAGEGYVRYFTRQFGLPHTILRYADVYGETDAKLARHPLTYCISMLLEQRRPIIRGAVDEARDHICIEDVVRANLSVLTRGQNQTLHISSGESYSLRDLFGVVAMYLQSEIEPLYLSQTFSSSVPVRALDNTRAYRVLGWRPERDFAAGVQWAVERFCERQGWDVPVMPAMPMLVEVVESTTSRERYLVGAR